MVKRLTRDSGGKISSQNVLTINNGGEINVQYENLDSVWYDKLGQTNLVCPRGKYHPTNPNDGTSLEPTGFNNNGDWDLHCFEHHNPYYIYIAYFSNKDANFFGNRSNGRPWQKKFIRNEIYATKFRDQIVYDDHHQFMSLASDNGYLKLHCAELVIKEENQEEWGSTGIDLPETCLIDIGVHLKAHTHAYFSYTDDTFYYVTYDSYSMITGYSKVTYIPDYSKAQNNVNSGNLVKNEVSPLNFLNDVTIEKMDLIPGTNFLFYTLNNGDSGKYYGIIDIIANQVIFNTDQEITSMIPDKDNQLFIITPTSAFVICLYKDSNNNCLYSCSDNKVLSPEGNTCGISSSICNLKLQPENLCINHVT